MSIRIITTEVIQNMKNYGALNMLQDSITCFCWYSWLRAWRPAHILDHLLHQRQQQWSSAWGWPGHEIAQCRPPRPVSTILIWPWCQISTIVTVITVVTGPSLKWGLWLPVCDISWPSQAAAVPGDTFSVQLSLRTTKTELKILNLTKKGKKSFYFHNRFNDFLWC